MSTFRAPFAINCKTSNSRGLISELFSSANAIERLAGAGFVTRGRKYNFLRYTAEANTIPDLSVPEEFAKEHLRITFNNRYMAEISDIDGLFWGNQHTYPIEIEEKAPADSKDMGLYFGLDIGPFVKLAYYAAKRGNLHSLYVVREIVNATDRSLVRWSYITFDHLPQFASWGSRAGGDSLPHRRDDRRPGRDGRNFV
jgi:hypothetical protein